MSAESGSIPIKRKEEEQPNLYRLHATLYTLLYPAFLGSIIVVIITSGNFSEVIANGWVLGFLLAYFASQHVVNAVDFENYSWPMLVTDCLELGLMIWLFWLLGIFKDTPTFSIPAGKEAYFFGTLALCLMLPVVARWMTLGRKFTKKSRDLLMTILPLAASIVTLWPIWPPESDFLWYVLSALLVIYFTTCVFECCLSIKVLNWATALKDWLKNRKEKAAAAKKEEEEAS